MTEGTRPPSGFMAIPVEERMKMAAEARRRKIPPEKRSAMATMAAMRRWYSQERPSRERLKAELRRLAILATKAIREGEDDRAIRAIGVMAQFERMMLWLDQREGLAGGPALEIEDQTERRLAESRARREQALGLTEGAELAEEVKDGGDGVPGGGLRSAGDGRGSISE
jgi:hypothetical protein